MANFLRIALWNANGIIQHKEELQVFLQNQLIDIMLISETHLTYKSYLKILGYKIITQIIRITPLMPELP